MANGFQRPVVGISADRKQLDPHPYHIVGEKYVDAVVRGAGATPLLIPPLGSELDLDQVLDRVDGILLTGNPSNLEPHHYGGDAGDSVPPHDPQRDATTLPLITRAIEREVPLFAICRGCQEVNVAFGGTLLPKVQERDGKLDHREDHSQPLERRYAPVHEVRLASGGLLARLAGTERVMVNSLHGQGVDHLGKGLAIEALAPDDLVEAFTVQDAGTFALAVQWHPEWKVTENAFSMAIFGAFGKACQHRRRWS